MSEIFVNSSNGWLPESTKPIPEPTLTSEWHSSQGNIYSNTQDSDPEVVFEINILKSQPLSQEAMS